MPILFQDRNIRHFLGTYITKQAVQEIYLIAQESNDGAPPPPPKKKQTKHTHTTSQAPRGCPSQSQWSIHLIPGGADVETIMGPTSVTCWK